MPEIKSVIKDPVMILVGCKCDVRHDDKVKAKFTELRMPLVKDEDVCAIALLCLVIVLHVYRLWLLKTKLALLLFMNVLL